MSCDGPPTTADDTDDLQARVEDILDGEYGDAIYTVEAGTVWVSGMNEAHSHVANAMAETLVAHDIPTSLVRQDDAVEHNGSVFRYGEDA